MVTDKLLWSDYVIKETVPSLGDPGKTVTNHVGMTCPKCKTRLALMEHFGKQTCPNCGLHMVLLGNCLECTMAVTK